MNESILIRRFDKESFFTKSHDALVRVSLNDILYIEASGSYLIINRIQESSLTISFNLSEFEAKSILPDNFMRVHRSFIVNIDFIDKIIGNTAYIGNHRISISIHLRSKLMKRFTIIGHEGTNQNTQK